MAKISIIVPVYGVEKYLEEALNSLLNQTLKELEIIVLDDGGNDKCPQIIDEYAQKDSRIIAIHKQNGGYGQTCNLGLEKATGEYIAIFEPDDYVDSKMYEDLYSIAKKYDSDIVKSPFYDNLQNPKLKQLKKVCIKDEKIAKDRPFKINEFPEIFSWHPSIWSCIYKKDFLTKNNIKFLEIPGAGWTDNLFQVQTLCLAEKINYTSKAYYYWRRLNLSAADDLKDYSLPIKRSFEILDWLEENNINDKGILENIYIRTLNYLKIIYSIESIKDLKNLYEETKKLCNKMDESYITSKNKNFYNICKKHPALLRLRMLFRRSRKKLFSIHWRNDEKKVVLLGKYIINKIP